MTRNSVQSQEKGGVKEESEDAGHSTYPSPPRCLDLNFSECSSLISWNLKTGADGSQRLVQPCPCTKARSKGSSSQPQGDRERTLVSAVPTRCPLWSRLKPRPAQSLANCSCSLHVHKAEPLSIFLVCMLTGSIPHQGTESEPYTDHSISSQ